MSRIPSSLPAARTPDPMDAPPLRWGIVGTGWIAERFASALRAYTRQQVYAVGSRSPDTAREFADRLGASVAYGSYAALVADRRVDVVYVATPHNLHHEHARLALEAGKPCLVEKPMALDAAQVLDLAALAASRGLFLMEAMWTVCLPKFDVVRRLLEDGGLGTVRSVVADIGESFGPEHRIMRADLAGGPMYDLGTYPVMFATWVLGEPVEVAAVSTPAPADLSPSGVDGQTAAVLRTAAGGVAALHATILGDTPTTATVVGSEATLVLDGPFYQPGGFTVLRRSGGRLRYDEPAVGHTALFYEGAEAARRIGSGELESPLRTLADTVMTMTAMDAIRRDAQVAVTGEGSGGVAGGGSGAVATGAR